MDFDVAFEKLVDKLQSWLNGIIIMLPNIVVAIFVFMLFFIAARLIRRGSMRLIGRYSEENSLNRLITNVVVFIVIAIGLLVALGVLNLDKTVTSILAGAGIIGIALGFAFQDIAANFISGVFITVRRPFKKGDLIKSNDYEGVVQRIDLRTTQILLFQGQMALLPNQKIFQNPLINYTQTGRRRIDITVGVSYGEDLQKVKDVAIAAVKKLEYIEQDPPIELFYKEFGDSSINFDIRFWIDQTRQPDFLKAKSEAIMNIKADFDAHEITIPFPIRTLDFGIKGGEKLSEVLKLQDGRDGQEN